LLLNTSGAAYSITEIVQLRAADFPFSHQVDVRDDRGVHEKSSLHTNLTSDTSYREVFVHPATASSYDGALKHLQAFAFTFTDFHMDPDGVAHTKVGDSGLQKVLFKFVDEVRHRYQLIGGAA
tara:strand:+ start:306 stop:674 length:369 start_codon:yes stop_codon:yes gene_type:complete